MSQQLISHSPDLAKLQNEGFEIEIRDGLLLVHHIPYVNSNCQISYGTLVSKLDLAGDKTVKPNDHVIYFIGQHPCHKDGSMITQIQHTSTDQQLTESITINHSFSSKPRSEGYLDYYEKIDVYTKIISHPAKSIDQTITERTFKVVETNDQDSVFKYYDTNSSRAEISPMSPKFENLKIAIIGLGGTGSYVLDMVSKTPVKEIHLFDGDDFLQHNAFRTPGAASLEELNKHHKKVAYLHGMFSQIHRFIVPHDYNLTATNLGELSTMDYVFICIDRGETRKLIVDYLVAQKIAFIDTGVGIDKVDGLLRGSVRVTTCTPEMINHLERRLPFSDDGNEEYAQNIQISEINALNAVMAVIKWKKLLGFYHDQEREFHSVYNIDLNNIINDETNP